MKQYENWFPGSCMICWMNADYKLVNHHKCWRQRWKVGMAQVNPPTVWKVCVSINVHNWKSDQECSVWWNICMKQCYHQLWGDLWLPFHKRLTVLCYSALTCSLTYSKNKPQNWMCICMSSLHVPNTVHFSMYAYDWIDYALCPKIENPK